MYQKQEIKLVTRTGGGHGRKVRPTAPRVNTRNRVRGGRGGRVRKTRA